MERLTNVFYVADDAIIDRVTDVVEGAVLMPAGIAVTVKALADKAAIMSGLPLIVKSALGA